MSINKPLSSITAEDIISLVQSGARESRVMDFKQLFSLDPEGKKAEFLADVSAFANTSWGDLIYGIEETDGVATNAVPFPMENIDQEILAIEGLIRDGIEPRVQADPRFVPSGDKFFLVVRIKKSWLPPHRVIHTGSSRVRNNFYGRNAGWNYQLDIVEIRRSFVSSETLSERINSFRAKRLLDIWSGNLSSFALREWWKLVLHVLPINSLTWEWDFNIDNVLATSAKNFLVPISGNGIPRINYDGFATYESYSDNIFSYVQLFRNWMLEAVESGNLIEVSNDGLLIPPVEYEAALLKALNSYMEFLRLAEIPGPFSVHLSLLWAKGFRIGLNVPRFRDNIHPIDRDHLETPSCLIEDLEISPESILRPMFDVIWNACWLPKSRNFDDNWVWIASNWRR